jgi:hypothetical protein
VRQVDSKTLRAVPSRYIMKIYKIKFHGTASVESDSLPSAASFLNRRILSVCTDDCIITWEVDDMNEVKAEPELYSI